MATGHRDYRPPSLPGSSTTCPDEYVDAPLLTWCIHDRTSHLLRHRRSNLFRSGQARVHRRTTLCYVSPESSPKPAHPRAIPPAYSSSRPTLARAHPLTTAKDPPPSARGKASRMTMQAHMTKASHTPKVVAPARPQAHSEY